MTQKIAEQANTENSQAINPANEAENVQAATVSNEQADAPEAPKKKKRRGISNETRSTSRLKFHENDANPTNGLFLGELANCEVRWVTIGEDAKGMTSFRGIAIPKLVFTFTSPHTAANDKRYVTHELSTVESNADTIPGGKSEWQINIAFGFIKHIIDVFYLKGKPMSEEMEDALALDVEDYEEDEYGNMCYVPVDAEDIAKAWGVLFESAANIINTGKAGKPIYKDDKGNTIKIWMKLLRFQKRKDKNTKAMSWYPVANGNQAGDLAFNGMIGDGCIELYRQGVPSNIKIDTSKESITPKEVAKAPNMNQAMGGIMSGGVTIGSPMGGVQTEGFAQAGAESEGPLPF